MHLPLLLVLSILGLSASANTSDDASEQDPISYDIRVHWMRRAIAALPELTGSPCPSEAFGAVIVNHTASDVGELVCMGVNSIKKDGNPTLHGMFSTPRDQSSVADEAVACPDLTRYVGEIAAINNCSTILTSPTGPHDLSGPEALSAFSQLSLYTTAEACPMCATAIRYAQFAEYIYATSADTLIDYGWPQINITSREVFARSLGLPKRTRMVRDLLRDETDGLFGWQYRDGECPNGCGRKGTRCMKLEEDEDGHDEL